jgi:hypothetical protein
MLGRTLGLPPERAVSAEPLVRWTAQLFLTEVWAAKKCFFFQSFLKIVLDKLG